MTPYQALKAALESAGSQAELAKIANVSQPAVWKWLHQSKRVPAEAVLAIEQSTGVSRHDLRPDIYPRPQPITAQQNRRADDDAALSPWETGNYGNIDPNLDLFSQQVHQ